MPRPTIADVAKAANVSVSTVDRVLSGRHSVREATAERVQRAAEAVGFHLAGTIRHRLGQDRPARTLGFLLQQRQNEFYETLGQVLQEATDASTTIRGQAVVRFRDYQEEEVAAECLLQLGRECNAVAVVAADHPKVTQAIDTLHEEGVPVFALISELTAANSAGYVGLDNWQVGGTAAWFLSNMCRTPGKIGICVGSLCFQRASEMRFRSYFRERAPEFQLLDSTVTLDDERYAYECTRDLLRQTPDLVGIYVAGGSITGVIRALRELPSAASRNLVVIGRELIPDTMRGLIEGLINVVLSHPKKLLAETLVEAMAQSTISNQGGSYVHPPIPFDIYAPENLWAFRLSDLRGMYEPGWPWRPNIARSRKLSGV
ncbi:LacI family DNA-binding transcriptional regulator [Methylobacterium nodulans]|uniref:Transcriptional regulator, LacI family n=1 Tax=Methylobacterium nodulans (strain LMG 21967 / CNCM I-2342 / ORS 2060) TaxID=460265 RepID=B8ITK6_METNO|nr:substrate-binding domain-containing protein [Methylobacterium nodulans]ACL58922.1 transcriptional regulator, LacI family [Methylobacterium nodulans ORS 2060]